jgi:hypothetical protein
VILELFEKVRACFLSRFCLELRAIDERIDSELTHVCELVANRHGASVHFLIVHTENAGEER